MAGDRENNPNSEATAIAFIVVAILVIVGVWFTFRAPLVYATYALDWVQVKIRQFFFGLNDRGLEYLHHIESVFNGRQIASDITWSEFSTTSNVVGTVFFIPLVVLTIIVAAYTWYKMPGDKFKRTLSLRSFKQYQSEHWGTLVPSARFDPDHSSKNMQPADPPVTWLNKIGVLAHLSNVNGNTEFDEVSRLKIEKELTRQLGKPWTPISRQPTYVRALIAIFVAHANDMKGSLDFRSKIADIMSSDNSKENKNKLVEELISPILNDEKMCKKIFKIADQHAYVSTVVVRLLRDVRRIQGVLASAEFLWLKEIDRDLWYAANDTDRASFHIESCGISSHYFYERVASRPFPEPKIDKGIEAIEEYIIDQGIDQTEQETEDDD